MKHLSSIMLAAAVLAAGTVACFKDPTSSLRKGPVRIILDRSSIFLTVGGDSLRVQAELKDEQGNTYDVPDAEWYSSDSTVAFVHALQGVYIPYNALARAFVRTAAPGQAWVYFTTHGLKDSIQVVGIPPLFTGAITAPSGSMLGDTITIGSMPNVTWSGSSTITIGGKEVWLLSQTPTQMQVLSKVPANNGPVVFGNLTLIGTVTLATLNSADSVAVADTARYYYPANTTRAGAAVVSLAGTSPTSPLTVYGAMDANAATYWNYWTFTLADSAAVTATLSWFGDGSGSDNDNPDFDVIICGPAPVTACGYSQDLAGNAGAGTSQPETFTTDKLAAGQYYIRTFAYSTGSFVLYQLKLNQQ